MQLFPSPRNSTNTIPCRRLPITLSSRLVDVKALLVSESLIAAVVHSSGMVEQHGGFVQLFPSPRNSTITTPSPIALSTANRSSSSDTGCWALDLILFDGECSPVPQQQGEARRLAPSKASFSAAPPRARPHSQYNSADAPTVQTHPMSMCTWRRREGDVGCASRHVSLLSVCPQRRSSSEPNKAGHEATEDTPRERR